MFCVKANPQLNKESFNFNVHGKYPYFTRTTNNNGILGYVDYLDEEHKIQGESIAVGMLGMRFFYMDRDFYAGQFTKTLFPTYSFLNKNNVQYFIALLNKQSGLYKSVLVRDFEKVFYDSKLLLPVKGGKIDFDFIEFYMRELEQERICELEQYLRVTGLDTYTLTPREHEILTSHAGGVTCLFRIGDLFEVKKGTRLIKSHMRPGLINFIGSTACNNGITATISNTEHLHPGNSITVTYNGSVGEAFYQSDIFWASDDVNVLYAKKNINEYIALFIIPYLRKIGTRYGYTFKWTKEKMQNDEIELPVTDSGEIDFEYMETYIRAIEKVVIRGVVEWKNKVIEATKSVVNA